MTPQEIKNNFVLQLEEAQTELTRSRQALTRCESLVLKLQGAVEAMDLLLEEGSEEEVSGPKQPNLTSWQSVQHGTPLIELQKIYS